MTRFVVISSGKGGVGKTTFAVNLASALSFFGRQVILVDTHFSTPHVGLKLGSPQFEKTLQHCLKDNIHLKHATYKHQSGMQIIPSSISLDHLQHNDTEKLIERLPDLKGAAEVVLLDSGITLKGETLSLLDHCDDLLLVTTPDMLSITDTLKAIKYAKQKKITLLGVIVNKVKEDPHEMSLPNIQELLDVPIIGVIPYDHDEYEASHLKHPVTHSHPDSKSTHGYRKVAANMIGEEYEKEEPEKVSLKDRFTTLVDDIKSKIPQKEEKDEQPKESKEE